MGQAHLRLFLALAIAVVAAVSASPAAAGSHGTVSTVCGAEVFDGLAALTQTGTPEDAMGRSARAHAEAVRALAPQTRVGLVRRGRAPPALPR